MAWARAATAAEDPDPDGGMEVEHLRAERVGIHALESRRVVQILGRQRRGVRLEPDEAIRRLLAVKPAQDDVEDSEEEHDEEEGAGAEGD